MPFSFNQGTILRVSITSVFAIVFSQTLDRAGSLQSSGLLRATNTTQGQWLDHVPLALPVDNPSQPPSRQSLAGGPLLSASCWTDPVVGGSGTLHHHHHYMDRFYGLGGSPPLTPHPNEHTADLLRSSNMDVLFASLEERAGFEQRVEELEQECDRLRTHVRRHMLSIGGQMQHSLESLGRLITSSLFNANQVEHSRQESLNLEHRCRDLEHDNAKLASEVGRLKAALQKFTPGSLVAVSEGEAISVETSGGAEATASQEEECRGILSDILSR